MTEPTLCVDRLTPAIGAVIAGVDLSRECSAPLLNRLYELLLEHLVLFLPDQTLTPDTLLAFAATFGELDTPHHVYPHVPGYERIVLLENDGDRRPNTDVWHTDLTFKQHPPFASILYAKAIPASGGDTLWCSMYAAYDALPAGMKVISATSAPCMRRARTGINFSPRAVLSVSRRAWRPWGRRCIRSLPATR